MRRKQAGQDEYDEKLDEKGVGRKAQSHLR
jgi:hypothetical protein